MKIVIFGCGMVGSAIVKDLADDKEFEILAVDTSTQALENIQGLPGVSIEQADLGASGIIPALVDGAELVISAVPGSMGFNTLKRTLEAGKNTVDISFFPEDPFELDQLAREKGLTAVVDCGVAPGLCNLIAGYVTERLDQTDSYHCYVGGLPLIRRWPYEYQAVFSPADVLEEYTRPARFIESGEEIVYPALSGLELIDFPGIGTLEAFNTDGLRTLRDTLEIPTMREKTLRYPGHAELMRAFRESGFFDPEPLTVDGQLISPLSLTSRLLFDEWKMKEGDRDLTVMQVILTGRESGVEVVYQYDLVDHYDTEKKISSMARTTGYTCTIVARQLLAGLFNNPGICPPELIGRQPGIFQDLLERYQRRNIHLQESITRN